MYGRDYECPSSFLVFDVDGWNPNIINVLQTVTYLWRLCQRGIHVEYSSSYQREMSKEVVIVLVGADKVPQNRIAFPYAYCSIASSDSHGPKRFLRVNALEMKALVVGILSEKAVVGSCLFLYVTWQPQEASAKLFRKSAFHSTAKPPSSVSPA